MSELMAWRDSLEVFTVYDGKAHPGLDRLLKSAEFWGWKVQLVEQLGFERDTYRSEQQGAISALYASEKSFFLYLDAWDTIFSGPPQELPLRRGTVSFCGDLNCFPLEALQPLYHPVAHGEFPYLNAGVIWGDRALYVTLCQEYLSLDNNVCNQDFLAARFLYEQSIALSRLFIDHRAEVALNLWSKDPKYDYIGRKGRRTWYKPTDTTPIILHAAGSSSNHVIPPMPPAEVVRYASETGRM